MKLRIKDDTLRLRLTRSEVESVARTGRIRAAARFPGGRTLEYVLESAADAVAPDASFADDRILVRLPETTVRAWASSDSVTIAGDVAVSGGTLEVCVEKDFACLSPREGEDESDMFEHPDAGTRTC